MRKPTRRLTVVAQAPRLPAVFQISDGELAALRDDVFWCRRTRALSWLEHRRNLLSSADPAHPNTPAMLACLVEWAQPGSSLVEALAELESRFPEAHRDRLPLVDYLFLRFSGAVLNFLRGLPDRSDLAFVITVASAGCGGNDLLLLAHLRKAEMERKKGALEPALSHAKLAEKVALQSGYPALAAKSQALHALILLDSGLQNPVELLGQADAARAASDDWLWRGRIQNGFGQIALQQGHYQSALDHLMSARDFFGRSEEPHSELGWAHFHLARAQRLMASRLARNIDAAAELRRRSRHSGMADRCPHSHSRQQLEQLRSEACVALSRAEAVFHSIEELRALDSIILERAALSADCGDLQQATQLARESFLAGRRHNDALLMAQARQLESRIEKMYCEEGVGPDLTAHEQRAREYIKEALGFALQCEATPSVKRRLLAAVYVSEGLLLLSEFFNNPEAARECCHSAGEYVNSSETGELWDEYQSLVARALHSGSIDMKLRKWSEGLAEGKPFQEITEEFAEVVIPAVWAREGKSTAHVVTKLSISPKKVRRILNRVGLKG